MTVSSPHAVPRWASPAMHGIEPTCDCLRRGRRPAFHEYADYHDNICRTCGHPAGLDAIALHHLYGITAPQRTQDISRMWQPVPNADTWRTGWDFASWEDAQAQYNAGLTWEPHETWTWKDGGDCRTWREVHQEKD